VAMGRAAQRLGHPRRVALRVGDGWLAVSDASLLGRAQHWALKVGPPGASGAGEDATGNAWMSKRVGTCSSFAASIRPSSVAMVPYTARREIPNSTAIAARARFRRSRNNTTVTDVRSSPTPGGACRPFRGITSIEPCDQLACLRVSHARDSEHLPNGIHPRSPVSSSSVIRGSLRRARFGRH